VGTLVLLALVLIGIRLYFSPDRLKRAIQPHLTEALLRTLSFDRAQLFFGFEPGLRLSHLVIQDRGNNASKPLLEAEMATYSLSPIAFLMGEGRIGKLHLENGRVNLSVKASGATNVDDLLNRLQLPVNELALDAFTLSYDNTQTPLSAVLRVQSASLIATLTREGFDLSGDVSIESLMVQSREATTRLPGITLGLHLSINPKLQRIHVAQFAMDFGPVVPRFTGQINWRTLQAELHAEKDSLDWERVRTYLVAQSVLSSRATLAGEGTLELDLSGAWPWKIAGQLTATAVSLSDPERLKSPILNGELHLTTDGTHLRIHALQFRSGLSDVTLSGILTHPADRPHLSFALLSRVADIDGFFAQQKAAQAQWGLVSPAHAAPGTKKSALISLLGSLDVDGSVRADSLRIFNSWISNLSAVARADTGALRVNPITGQVFGGALSSSILLSTGDGMPHLSARVSLINADAHPLIEQSLGWQVPLFGDLGLSLRVSAGLDSTLGTLPHTQRITGKAQMHRGKLVQWGILKNSLKTVESLGLLTADEVSIEEATVIFNLEARTLTLNGTQFTAAGMPCRVTGTGEPGGKMNYDLDVDVPPARLHFGGFNLGALLGKQALPVRIHIQGTTLAPDIRAGLR
ncbi:MAG: AsmA family protein, partial [bacterium]|nr:AsmA family protein [bacterium]